MKFKVTKGRAVLLGLILLAGIGVRYGMAIPADVQSAKADAEAAYWAAYVVMLEAQAATDAEAEALVEAENNYDIYKTVVGPSAAIDGHLNAASTDWHAKWALCVSGVQSVRDGNSSWSAAMGHVENSRWEFAITRFQIARQRYETGKQDCKLSAAISAQGSIDAASQLMQ